MTLNNTILKKINNFKIFILDLIPIASNNTPQSNTTTGSSGNSLEYARADHVHPTDTSRASSTHTHGSISNTGTLNSDTSTVNKVVVTDGSNNVKTISKLPIDNINNIHGSGASLWNMNFDANGSFSFFNDKLIYNVNYDTIYFNNIDDDNELAVQGNVNTRAPKNHASTTNTYGLGSTSNYGHVKTINSLSQSSHSDGTALSAYQGKVLNDKINNAVTKSSTPGYLKNDGTVGTPTITDVSDVETVSLTITYTDDSTQTLDFVVKK